MQIKESVKYCPYTGKYRSKKAYISVFFTQWIPHEGVSILVKLETDACNATVDMFFELFHNSHIL